MPLQAGKLRDIGRITSDTASVREKKKGHTATVRPPLSVWIAKLAAHRSIAAPFCVNGQHKQTEDAWPNLLSLWAGRPPVWSASGSHPDGRRMCNDTPRIAVQTVILAQEVTHNGVQRKQGNSSAFCHRDPDRKSGLWEPEMSTMYYLILRILGDTPMDVRDAACSRNGHCFLASERLPLNDSPRYVCPRARFGPCAESQSAAVPLRLGNGRIPLSYYVRARPLCCTIRRYIMMHPLCQASASFSHKRTQELKKEGSCPPCRPIRCQKHAIDRETSVDQGEGRKGTEG